jgi:hypothetical protein
VARGGRQQRGGGGAATAGLCRSAWRRQLADSPESPTSFWCSRACPPPRRRRRRHQDALSDSACRSPAAGGTGRHGWWITRDPATLLPHPNTLDRLPGVAAGRPVQAAPGPLRLLQAWAVGQGPWTPWRCSSPCSAMGFLPFRRPGVSLAVGGRAAGPPSAIGLLEQRKRGRER